MRVNQIISFYLLIYMICFLHNVEAVCDFNHVRLGCLSFVDIKTELNLNLFDFNLFTTFSTPILLDNPDKIVL